MIEQVAGWVRRHFWPRESFLQTSNGSTSAGKPIVLNRSGLVDQTMLSGTDLAEYVADTVGAMVSGNTETGITVTYQDADNTIDFEVSAEFIADTVGAMLSGNTETGITVTYDDTDNTIDFDAQTAGDARYLPINGTVLDFNRFHADVADIGSTQVLTIDVTYSATEDRLFDTAIRFVGTSANNSARRAIARADIQWRTTAIGGAATLISYDLYYHIAAGTPAVSISTITDGVRLSIASSAFGGTLNSNVVVVESLGTNASSMSHTVTIT